MLAFALALLLFSEEEDGCEEEDEEELLLFFILKSHSCHRLCRFADDVAAKQIRFIRTQAVWAKFTRQQQVTTNRKWTQSHWPGGLSARHKLQMNNNKVLQCFTDDLMTSGSVVYWLNLSG